MTDWPQIVRQYGPLVWRTAVRLLRNEADAEDCFQATFLSAWQISRTQEVRSWPALLKQVATRRALESLRKLDRSEELAMIQGAGPRPGRGPAGGCGKKTH